MHRWPGTGSYPQIGGLTVRTIKAEIGGLRAEMNAGFDSVAVRFDASDRRIDGIDRDLRTVVNRLFGNNREL